MVAKLHFVAIAVVLVGSVVLAVSEPVPRPVTPPAVLPGQKPPGKIVPPPGGPEAAPPVGQSDGRVEGSKPMIAGDDAAVQPFLDDNTFLVARVDASAMDLKAQQEWLLSAMDLASSDKEEIAQAKKELPKVLDQESAWVGQFAKAGGKRLYMVMSLSETPKYGPFIVVPLDKGANAKSLIALFPGAGPQSQPAAARAEGAARVGDAVVFGELAIINRLRNMPAAKPRPDLSQAMAAAGQLPVRIAIIASDSLRNELEAVLPLLPDEFGGGSIKAISRGISWGAAALNVPPNASLRFILKATDAKAAANLLALQHKAIDWADANAGNAPVDVKRLTSLVAGKVQGDRLTIALDAKGVKDAVGLGLLPAFLKARQQAGLVRSIAAEHQLAMGCLMYAAEHKNHWPETFDDIAQYEGGKAALAKLLIDPVHPGTSPGYVYKKPSDPEHHAGETIVIYEAKPADTKTPAHLYAAYADGHCEYITQAELKRQLSEKKGL